MGFSYTEVMDKVLPGLGEFSPASLLLLPSIGPLPLTLSTASAQSPLLLATVPVP
jgi:hypothetical protein